MPIRPKFVVITGGPGAGKTAILELARKILPESHVRVLPEAATILFRGGFPRYEGVAAQRAIQRAIYHVQDELETLAIDEDQVQVVLCDRGTVDGLAYWPGVEQDYFDQVHSNKAREVQRYAAVIHLRTPSLEHGYNLENPVRVESAEQAALIDQALLKIWSDHPKRYLIEASSNFLDKAMQTLKIINELILTDGKSK